MNWGHMTKKKSKNLMKLKKSYLEKAANKELI